MPSRINAVTEPQNDDVSSPISITVQDSSRSTLADATLTSRISIQKFCCVVSQFSNFKRGLVTETGFGGLMHLKITHKLNLKFSSSLMFRVDPDECVLELDQSRRILITNQDVNDVFGLSQGSRIIPPGHSDLSEVCIEFSRLASSISTKGVHSLKAAEFILSKLLDETSSKVECECFKIAFVIFSLGHVLNPCAKHDYTRVDYWAALVVPSEMNSYNWCMLVKDSLMKGVRKIKSDIANCNTTNHIVGCHLLLQVIALDKIEKSSRHIAQNILPRVKVFDHESVKKAIDSFTSHQGQEVIYAGSECVLNDVSKMKVHHPNPTSNKICGPSSLKCLVRAASKIKPRSSIGPVEFANIMRRKYPNMADDLIGIILKEHDTRLMANMTEIRHTTQMGMLKFLDELAACLSNRCICCQLAGLTTCRLVDNNTPGHGMVNDRLGHQEELSDSEACSSTGHVHQARKRVYVHSSDNIIEDTHIGINKKHQNNHPGSSFHDGDHDNLSVSQSRLDWATDSSADLMTLVYHNDKLFSSLVLAYEDCTGVCFAQLTDTTPPAIELSCKSFVSDPWSSTSNQHALPADPSKIIAFCISNDQSESMTRTWIEHPTPRLLTLQGNILRDQIMGKEAISHECFTLIVRRLAQIERTNSKDADFAIWRKFIEPDFTTLVIRNIDPTFAVFVQTELLMEKHIDQCRMFIFHTPLHYGWCSYILDMLRKRIVVLDLQAGPFGFTTDRVKFHEQISHAIHGAFFRCVNSIFSSWPCNPNGWTREFPTLMIEKITSAQSGIYSLFMATHYDGETLRNPTTKENIYSFRRAILLDVMKLEDNKSDAPYKAMQHIRSTVNNL